MSLKSLRDFSATLSFRLAVWYAAVFGLSCVVAFVICYLLVASHLTHLMDDQLRMEVTEYRNLYAKGGLAALHEELSIESKTEDPAATYFRLLSDQGRVLDGAVTTSWSGLTPVAQSLRPITDGADTVIGTMQRPGSRHQIRYIYGRIAPGVILDFGMRMKDEENFLSVFRRILITTAAVMTLASGLIGWFMSRRALVGITHLTETALAIKKGSMDRRVPIKSRGLEIDTLAITFNEMLDNVESLVGDMRELTDNIAHDLRNPIAAIRGRAELALVSGKDRDELSDVTAATVDDCDRMLQMINNMLDLAEAESGAMKLRLEEVDLAELAAGAVEMFEHVAEEKGITIRAENLAGVSVLADRQGLQRIVVNLLDNACKYSHPGGVVTVSATTAPGSISLAIADTGIGIADAEMPHLFKRFFRGDRSRSEKGFGLGLSLARAIARAHRGEITARSRQGEGTVFTVTLPR